jgi:hypothetical protein
VPKYVYWRLVFKPTLLTHKSVTFGTFGTCRIENLLFRRAFDRAMRPANYDLVSNVQIGSLGNRLSRKNTSRIFPGCAFKKICTKMPPVATGPLKIEKLSNLFLSTICNTKLLAGQGRPRHTDHLRDLLSGGGYFAATTPASASLNFQIRLWRRRYNGASIYIDCYFESYYYGHENLNIVIDILSHNGSIV